MSRCEEFLRSRDHVDLDVAPAQLWEHQWEQFLTEYYSIAQGGAKIQVSTLVNTEPASVVAHPSAQARICCNSKAECKYYTLGPN